MLVAFDVLASDKADLERLFRLLTQAFCFSDSRAEQHQKRQIRACHHSIPAFLAGYIAPDNLTITLSVGHSLFDERFGLAPQMPKAAEDDAFPQRLAGCGVMSW